MEAFQNHAHLSFDQYEENQIVRIHCLPLSSIHVVLQRLVKSGEVKVMLQKGGHKGIGGSPLSTIF
jgi:hypothetical protein